ncbi:peptidase M20 [Alkalihalobacillus alcalophilus ATCC 27647 = CGMCC 1.3604]|uniref:Peptidase M20 n=1 Tax=Alkalihalobacillus alcalophilus ATCC 27647 = CGMCC 1.3604 TaxID=1218173 RepID=A0A094Z039_ALKAL|nr:amidohydrolase [Alkalihalobacillus alcalophilus]KGA99182.1 peptidase M20 [Alkalihalobacillus alcalophilus ATCC 27647 = CGMCC 1.3604]MED1561276.1 amidohydrolase [Alkalihalobacillus alcalophilus]THG90095.1 peptidase M20 [Alkalihalobacillus alcalophilus ATCC 27647 = CGMCC 1.3604]
MIERVLAFLEQHEEEMIEIRRELHQYPELSFEEVETPKKIATYLKDLGVEVKTGVGGRGVVGYIRGAKPGKTVALRADFDALPIQEETGLSFASKTPGVMHACGHDGHTASLLLVAKALMKYKDELEGTIVLIHQFAEELAPGGAIQMIEDGCLEGVDVIYGTHLWSPFEVGEIGYTPGPAMAAADRFEIDIQGKGGHGAAPHETVDAIMVASSVVQSLQQIVSRNVDPLKAAVVTVASFHAGGPFNVISDTAKLVGTVRTFDLDLQDYIIERMEQVTKGICEAMGASYTYLYKKGYPALVNDPYETSEFARIQTASFPEQRFFQMEPVMGGEDFSYYLQHVPGTFFFTGAGNKEKGINYPHHHPKFDIDEAALLTAAKLLASSALTYLSRKKSKVGSTL